MPEPLTFKKQRPRKATHYWVVSLGRKYTGTSRQRRYFRSRKAAKDFVAQAEVARRQMGHEAFLLPLSLRAEALVCSQKLKPLDVSLTHAVNFFINQTVQTVAVPTFEKLKVEFLKSRKEMNCRPRTLVQYESYLRVICEEFGKTEVAKILRQDIEDWMEESDWSPRTRRNYLVTLTTLMNYAVVKGYCRNNPAAGIDRPILDDRPVEILKVEQVTNLLKVSLSLDPELAPVLAIGLFAGLRRSEFHALEWSEIDFKHRIIEVNGIKAKTRQRRLVHISDNLLEWLSDRQKEVGPVLSDRSIDTFSERLREVAHKAGINPWPHNAMRHSFGSYFLGMTKDENLTAAEMGNSPGVVIHHYRAVVRDAEVTEYWRINPTTILRVGRLQASS